ncbi:MAG: potassium-transporting ATPase subunit B, partial [Bacteroidales bacterium]
MESERKNEIKLLTRRVMRASVKEAFIKLTPSNQLKNPVIFIVLIGAVITTGVFFNNLFSGQFSAFVLQITVWLWFTVLFANFAEAIAEGRGKAQAESLRKSKSNTKAIRLNSGKEEEV